MKNYYILLLLFLLPIYAIAQEEDNEKFIIVETMPEPIGGLASFYKYVSKNLEYPKKARKMGIEGKVLVQFIVDKDGSIINAQVFKGINPECDAEALRVIKNAPKWSPGLQKGKPVKVKITVPIIFKLIKGKKYRQLKKNKK